MDATRPPSAAPAPVSQPSARPAGHDSWSRPVRQENALGRRSEASPGAADADLDRKIRRGIVRIGIEVVVLALVLGAMNAGPIMRMTGLAPAATPTPSATARPARTTTPVPSAGSVTGLGLDATSITDIYALDALGTFDFELQEPSPDASAGASPGPTRLVGTSLDGKARLVLTGNLGDLEEVSFRIALSNSDQGQADARRRITTFLGLYAPDAVVPLLAAFDAAISAGKDATTPATSLGRIARLETHLSSPRSVTIRLLPLAPVG